MHLLHVFPSFALGGAQIRLAELANSLGPRYRHTIIALDGDFACRTRLGPEVSCAFKPVPVRKSRHRRLGNFLANLVAFRQVLKAERPDLLLTYNWGAIEWAISNRWRAICPHIHFEDGFGADESVDRQLARRVLVRRLVLRGATLVVPSQTLYRLATTRWALPPDKVRYIPNGIVTARFAVPPDPGLLGALKLSPQHPIIGTVAGLRPEKNLARLIRCFVALPPDCRPALVIVGDGPERGRLAALARELAVSDRVIFAGALAEPARILGAFDIFALSSDTEQMPFSLLEAMAAGLPVAATDVGDVKAVVGSENSANIVPCGDEAALTASLADLLRNAPRRRALGESNRQRVRVLYEQETMVATYDRLFCDAAARLSGDEG
jgi:L-malate glycosyltransferase